MSTVSGDSLTGTLEFALSQCRDQVRTLQAQSGRIDVLQRENEQLRKELQDARKERDDARQELGVNRQEPSEEAPAGRTGSSQTDELFEKNVEARAEIHKLRKKLKAYKEKANGRLTAPVSSPMSLPTTPITSSPKAPRSSREHIEHDREHSLSPPRKRARFAERDALQEVPVNIAHTRTSSTASKKSTVEKRVAAIPLLAEDGEEYHSEPNPARAPKPTLRKEDSAPRKLDTLLDAPTPGRAPLAPPRSVGMGKAAQSQRPASTVPVKNISNIRHTSTDLPPVSSAPAEIARSREAVPAASTPKSSVPVGSSTRRSFLSKSFNRAPEDEEPLRARPLNRLTLQNFRFNPQWLDSHGMSYEEFLHGKNGERIKALTDTLPNIPGSGYMTEDEILLEFLGKSPGSEARIASLTPVARKNLLDEAKMARVAQHFSNQRMDYDKEVDPPGFWSTDFPGSQEDKENREKARQVQREEVQRRYDEAMRGGGRWVFADE